MKPLRLPLFGLATVLALASTTLQADSDQALARRLRAEGKILSLEQIVERAQAVRPGTVIEADFDVENGRHVYELEIVDRDGVVWEIDIDAATGELIKLEKD